MVDRLAAEDGSRRINDSLVSNLREIAELTPMLNITNDPTLERIRREILENLDISADALRTDAQAREAAGANATRIMRLFSFDDAAPAEAPQAQATA